MRPRIFMWVQTRLGLGHLSRALNLCGALAKDGFDAVLAHGGPPVPALTVPEGVTLIQLPAAHAPKLESPEIVDDHGNPIDDAWRSRRIAALKTAIEKVQPQIVVTETFPLGRWLFAFEIIPILEWLHSLPARPLTAASVRDILAHPSKANKRAAMIDLAHRRYDLILCHADENIVRLPESFPETQELAGKTRYTGYVVDAVSSPAEVRTGVIVVAGGGAVGGALFEAAIEVNRRWTRDAGPWTLVAGPRFDSNGFLALREKIPADVIVEGAVENLRARYARTALVVAQAGYNTVCEALSAGAALTVVPYAAGKETEQLARARRFAGKGLLTYVEEKDLGARTLASAMERALDASDPKHSIRFDGGSRTASILREALARRAS